MSAQRRQTTRRADGDGGHRGRFDRGGRAGSASASSLIEGRRAAAEALRSGFPVRRALIAAGPDADRSLKPLLTVLERDGVPVKRVHQAQLDALSSHGAHQGIVLEAAPFPFSGLDEIISAASAGAALVVVLDHVTDEGNFGAIVRSAEVVGAAGVVVAARRAAGVGAGAFKTSAGALMHLPIARVPNIARAVDELKEAGFWVGAASEHAEQTVWEAPFEGRLALVLGSEGSGISRLVLERCDFSCRLPQRGRTESLNVAQAGAVLCYEWLRRDWAAREGAVNDDGGEPVA